MRWKTLADADIHLVNSPHRLHFFLFHFKLRLPQKVSSRDELALSVERMKHGNDDKQQQTATYRQRNSIWESNYFSC